MRRRIILTLPWLCCCAASGSAGASERPDTEAAHVAALREDECSRVTGASGELLQRLLQSPPLPLVATSSRDREARVSSGAAPSCEGWQAGQGQCGSGDGGVGTTSSAHDGGEITRVGGVAAISDALTTREGAADKDDGEEQNAEDDAGGEGYDADTVDEWEWVEEEGEYDDDDEEEEVEKVQGEVGDYHSYGTGGGSANYSRMTMNDMWSRAFDCDRIFRTVRPIHNESTWTFLRGVYLGVMMTASVAETTPQQSSDNQHEGSSTHCSDNQLLCNHGPTINRVAPLGSGFRKAVQAKQTDDGKGRGVYAAQLIRKGELVWTATASTARFPSGALYRQFLAIIPADLACDVLQWAYVQDVAHFHDTTAGYGNDLQNHNCHEDATDTVLQSPQQEPGTIDSPILRISVDLDEGSYMNGEDYDPNVGCLPEQDEEEEGEHDESQPTRTPPSHCQQNFYALRDIPVGKELLCYYGDFANSDGWAEFGL